MQEFTIRDMGNGKRCRWVYDEEYATVGSYALGSDDEDREAEEWELERLRDGRLVALGCIVEERCERTTYHRQAEGKRHQYDPETDTHWHELDSLWGIVIEPDDAKLDEFARDSMEGLSHDAPG